MHVTHSTISASVYTSKSQASPPWHTGEKPILSGVKLSDRSHPPHALHMEDVAFPFAFQVALTISSEQVAPVPFLSTRDQHLLLAFARAVAILAAFFAIAIRHFVASVSGRPVVLSAGPVLKKPSTPRMRYRDCSTAIHAPHWAASIGERISKVHSPENPGHLSCKPRPCAVNGAHHFTTFFSSVAAASSTAARKPSSSLQSVHTQTFPQIRALSHSL